MSELTVTIPQQFEMPAKTLAVLGSFALASARDPGVKIAHERTRGASTLNHWRITGTSEDRLDELILEAAQYVAADDSPWRRRTPNGRPLLWPVWYVEHLTHEQVHQLNLETIAVTDQMKRDLGDNHPLSRLSAGLGRNLGSTYTPLADPPADPNRDKVVLPTRPWVIRETAGLTPLNWVPGNKGNTLVARMITASEALTGKRGNPSWATPDYQAVPGVGSTSVREEFLSILALSLFPVREVMVSYSQEGKLWWYRLRGITSASHTIPVHQAEQWAWDHGELRIATSQEPLTREAFVDLQWNPRVMNASDPLDELAARTRKLTSRVKSWEKSWAKKNQGTDDSPPAEPKKSTPNHRRLTFLLDIEKTLNTGGWLKVADQGFDVLRWKRQIKSFGQSVANVYSEAPREIPTLNNIRE